MLVADSSGLVRSNDGLAHTLAISLDNWDEEGEGVPGAVLTNQGVRGNFIFVANQI